MAIGKVGMRVGIAGAGIAIVIVAAAGGIAYSLGWRLSYQPVVASCVADDAIPGDLRAKFDQAAHGFINSATGANPISAYALLSAETKASVPPDKFMAVLRQSLDPVEPFTDIHVQHAYFVRAWRFRARTSA